MIGSSSDREVLVEVRDLKKTYPTARGKLLVLDSVDFNVRRGEIVAVVGESGSGKSTLLHLLGALDRPDRGEVRFDGKDIFVKRDEALSSFRNQMIGFVFQFHHLLPEFTALENVQEPSTCSMHSVWRIDLIIGLMPFRVENSSALPSQGPS